MSSSIFEICKKKKNQFLISLFFFSWFLFGFLFFKHIHIERDVDSNRGNPTDEKGFDLFPFFFYCIWEHILIHSVRVICFSEKN